VAGASPSGKIGEIETSHGHLIKNIAIQSMKKKPKLNIYGNNYNTKDGTCVRDYIHVTDLADIHIKGIKFLKENKNLELKNYLLINYLNFEKEYQNKIIQNF